MDYSSMSDAELSECLKTAQTSPPAGTQSAVGGAWWVPLVFEVLRRLLDRDRP